MIRPPTFVRLPEGRLWHVSDGAWATACGRIVDAPIVGDDDKEPETLEGHVPAGAWVCRRCRTALSDWLHAVDMAIAADPRGRRTEALPEAVTEELAALAEEVRVSRETPVSGPEAVDLVAALKASVEAAYQRRIEAMGDAS